MIVGIDGKIVKKEPTLLHIKTDSGLTYGVKVSLYSSSKINIDDDISLHTTFIVREDQQTLFGFLDLDEKKIFDTVIKLNGIGPSTALAICSTLSPDEFSRALLNQSIESFKRVPGIGPKSAKRILVELSDFSLDSLTTTQSNIEVEALAALESLGFKKDKIVKVLQKCSSSDISSLIKEALKKLA